MVQERMAVEFWLTVEGMEPEVKDAATGERSATAKHADLHKSAKKRSARGLKRSG
jgi:hypothetical protein